ncbi:MAG: hypothetical protein AAF327_25920, partial [Cyanobacteria bacterium P01_A01_bin.37]
RAPRPPRSAPTTEQHERPRMRHKDGTLHSHVRVFGSIWNQGSPAYRFGTIYKDMAFHIWHPFMPNY